MGYVTSLSIHLEKRNELKKVLDKRTRIRYNEFIKNGIGTKSNLIRVEKKKEIGLKNLLTRGKELGIMSPSRARNGS